MFYLVTPNHAQHLQFDLMDFRLLDAAKIIITAIAKGLHHCDSYKIFNFFFVQMVVQASTNIVQLDVSYKTIAFNL